MIFVSAIIKWNFN